MNIQKNLPIREQLKKLIELQEKDLKSEALQDRIENLQQEVQEHREFLKKLQEALKKQMDDLKSTKDLRLAKQSDLKEYQHRLENAYEKMTQVTTSQQYAAAERESQNFKELITKTQAEIIQLKEAIEDAEKSIKERKKKIVDLQKLLDEKQREVESFAERIDEELRALEDEQDQIAELIRPDILRRYEFIREHRAGKAIVPAENGTCTGCHMRVPPQVYIRLQKGETVEYCENCQRILYYPD